MILTSTAESRLLDKIAMTEYGLPEAVLMENAGRAVVSRMREFTDWEGAFTVIVCGTGNNGGDGFVSARYARGAGARVLVILMGDPPHMGESAKMYRKTAEKMGIPVIEVMEAEEAVPYLYDADIIIDSLIGTGLASKVKGEKAALIDIINDTDALVVSTDIPSGLVTDTGRPAGTAVNADFTVALGSVKRGHVLYPGSEHTGRLLFSPIGIPEEASEDFPVRLLFREDIAPLLPVRNQISHKGKNGFLGIFAGSSGMEGAALLAGQGALYAGAGKTAIITTGDAAPIMAGKFPEIMVSSIGNGPHFTEDMAEAALEKAKAYDVIAIGPGIGRDEETMKFVKKMVENFEKTIILDADGLYAAAEAKIDFKSCPGRLILTPHVGEFARLTGLSASEIEEKRIDAASDFSKKNRLVLVLKGAPTVIGLPDGRSYVNTTGNPGMATGGMGDTLTGVIGAMAAQGMSPSSSAAVGVYLHGLAGDLAAETTAVGYRVTDLARLLPKARAQITEMDE